MCCDARKVALSRDIKSLTFVLFKTFTVISELHGDTAHNQGKKSNEQPPYQRSLSFFSDFAAFILQSKWA